MEEEEVEGRDVMDALQAGAPAAHGTHAWRP